MDRSELIRMFVLDAIADDDEELDRISEHVFQLGVRCGVTIRMSDILDGLTGLIKSGLAKAFQFRGTVPTDEIDGVPASYDSEGLYFAITNKGKEVQNAEYEPWPFDDKNALKKGWSPPSD